MNSRSFRRIGILGIMGCAVAAGINTARAGTTPDHPIGGGDSLSSTKPSTQDSDVPPPANLMSLFDKVGAGPTLDKLGIDIYGHVEGSYTKQFLEPNDQVAGRRYDFVQNRGLLNQAAINVERSINIATDHFDIGFRVQALEGTDAGYTESLQSHRIIPIPGTGAFAPTSSDYVFDVGGNNSNYQFDLPDLYVDFGIPLARGLRVRAGRFEFFKPIDPNDRIFFSTTFVYTNALPFTNTGVTVAYDFSDHLGFEAGFSRGENETVTDSNGSIDFIGKCHFDLSDKTSVVATGSVGPELTADSYDYTVLIDISGTQKVTQQISVLLDGIYAHQFGNSDASFGYNEVPTLPPTGHLPASYYGVSGNIVYQVNSYFSLAARAEWFRDDGGLLSGASRSLYEVTVGTTITPFPRDAIGQNLKFRPEVRWDYSNRNFFGPDANGVFTRKDQLTFGADVIYNF